MAVLSRDELQRLHQSLTDKGKIIEAGWIGLRIAAIDPTAPEIQINEMRMAFFAGAAHFFSAMMIVMEPGSEPTENDLRRMSLIHNELEEFNKTFAIKYVTPKGTG